MAAADDAAADGRPHAGAAGRRHAERVQQVARRVRIRRAHGQHGAGQHDRPVDVRQHMAQQRGGIGERIRAVREDEAVPVRAARPDRPRHGHAVGGGQVGRVQLHQLAHACLAHLRQNRAAARAARPRPARARAPARFRGRRSSRLSRSTESFSQKTSLPRRRRLEIENGRKAAIFIKCPALPGI